MANDLLPPQKPHTCQHCNTVNWLPVHPDPIAPISACLLFNCEKCGKTFEHVVGSGLTLYLVRCHSLLTHMWPLLAVFWFAAVVYSGWLFLHWFGVLPLAALMVLCVALAHNERHAAVASIPAALALFEGFAALARFCLIYLLHHAGNVNAITALMVLLVGCCVPFAPAAEYEPLRWYDGDRHGNAPPAGLPQPDDIAKAGL